MAYTEREELERLSALVPTSEDDVREEFVTPLLRLLGYEHSRGEVHRASKLRVPYYKAGTTRRTYIVPDYVAGVGQVCLLAIDAKAPGESALDSLAVVKSAEYVSQVHSYAAHREVQAARFIVSNGHYTAVYDTAAMNFDPICLVSQEHLTRRFAELEAVAGKRSLATLRAESLPLAWSRSIHHTEVGFQPINMDIGDVDHDGLDEIILGLSENHIPAYNLRGTKIFDHATDGWVWWVKCTHTRLREAATVVALQLPSQDGQAGSVLGLNRDGIMWRYPLKRMGSGFETLDRILVLRNPESVVVGIPVDDIVVRLTLTGEVVWETRVGVSSPFGAIMSIAAGGAESSVVLATANRQRDGVLATLDASSGRVLNSVDLPFRGAQIVLHPADSSRFIVTDADGPQLAVGSVGAASSPLLVFRHGCAVGAAPLVIDTDSQLVFVGGLNSLVAYSLPDLFGGRLSVEWEMDRIPGLVYRLRMDRGRRGASVLVATCGHAATPNANGVYLVATDGTISERLTIVPGPERPWQGPPGIRDAHLLRVGLPTAPGVVAVSDDWRLYAWGP